MQLAPPRRPSKGDDINTSKTTVMFIFYNSDLNAAAHHLAEAMQDPFAPNTVLSVFIQESVKEMFIEKLRPLLKPLDEDIYNHATYRRSLEIIEEMHLRKITALNTEADKSPIIVCDFIQNNFGEGFTGLVTMHTFRTTKDAINISSRETIGSTSASIWNENHSNAYELAMATNYYNYFFNCFLKSLGPLEPERKRGSNFVTIQNNYHYETFLYNNLQKSIVYPIGTIYGN